MFDSGHRATPATRGAEAAASYEREHGRDTQHGPAGAGPPGRRPRHVFEVEDLLLAGWIFAAEELVRRWGGDPLLIINEITPYDHGDGWMGVLQRLPTTGWIVLGLFLFILLTRGPEDTDRDVALGRRWPMLNLALPLLSIYALIASGVQQAIFGSPTLRPGEEPPWPGPYVPGIVRRTAAVPLAFLGDALFSSNLAGLELTLTYDMGLSTTPRMLLFMVLSVLPYSVFVAGPRIAAGAALAWRPWIIRFALFYVAIVARNNGFTW